MHVTIDKAGRLVVPKRIRDRWALRGGETLVLEDLDDRMVLRRTESDGELVERGGILTFRDSRGPVTLDETLDAIDKSREPRF